MNIIYIYLDIFTRYNRVDYHRNTRTNYPTQSVLCILLHMVYCLWVCQIFGELLEIVHHTLNDDRKQTKSRDLQVGLSFHDFSYAFITYTLKFI